MTKKPSSLIVPKPGANFATNNNDGMSTQQCMHAMLSTCPLVTISSMAIGYTPRPHQQHEVAIAWSTGADKRQDLECAFQCAKAASIGVHEHIAVTSVPLPSDSTSIRAPNHMIWKYLQREDANRVSFIAYNGEFAGQPYAMTFHCGANNVLLEPFNLERQDQIFELLTPPANAKERRTTAGHVIVVNCPVVANKNDGGNGLQSVTRRSLHADLHGRSHVWAKSGPQSSTIIWRITQISDPEAPATFSEKARKAPTMLTGSSRSFHLSARL